MAGLFAEWVGNGRARHSGALVKRANPESSSSRFRICTQERASRNDIARKTKSPGAIRGFLFLIGDMIEPLWNLLDMTPEEGKRGLLKAVY